MVSLGPRDTQTCDASRYMMRPCSSKDMSSMQERAELCSRNEEERGGGGGRMQTVVLAVSVCWCRIRPGISSFLGVRPPGHLCCQFFEGTKAKCKGSKAIKY